jgi:hypothetical protein
MATKVLFPDAISAGHFMQNFVGRLAEQQATGTLKETRPVLNQHLFVSTGKTKVDGSTSQ